MTTSHTPSLSSNSAAKSATQRNLILLGVAVLILALSAFLLLRDDAAPAADDPTEGAVVPTPVNPDNPSPFKDNPQYADEREETTSTHRLGPAGNTGGDDQSGN